MISLSFRMFSRCAIMRSVENALQGNLAWTVYQKVLKAMELDISRTAVALNEADTTYEYNPPTVDSYDR